MYYDDDIDTTTFGCVCSILWDVSKNFMTDSEKIINETKKYILEVFKSGLNKQQQTALKLKNGIDLFISKEFPDVENLKNEIIIVVKKN